MKNKTKNTKIYELLDFKQKMTNILVLMWTYDF